MEPKPDAIFAFVPDSDLGVIVWASEEAPFAHHVLTAHRFQLNAAGMYRMPDAPHDVAIRHAAQAVRTLRDAGLTVSNLNPRLSQEADSLVHSDPVNQAIRAERASQIADLIDFVIEDKTGALSQLHLFLETTATWCEHHPDQAGADMTRRFRSLAQQLEVLGDDLAWTGADLLDLSPAEQPQPRRDNARSRAATAISPSRSATPSPAAGRHTTTPQQAAPAQAPTTGKPRSR